MNTSFGKQLTLFDIQNYEYSILISPTRKVKGKVVSFKRCLNTIMKVSDRDLYSTPHISLLKLKYTNNDSFIIFQLKRALMHSKKFQIKLKGIDHFNNKTSNTVYVKIANPAPIASVYRTLLTSFAVSERQLIPHLTIARGVSDFDLESIQNAIPEYQESFCCDRITVLKKPLSNFNGKVPYTKIYEVVLN